MSKSKILIVTALFIICSTILTAGDKNLSLKISEPADGSVSFPVDGEITLEFSNNVVNRNVQDINSTCFHLSDAEGNSVELKVVFPDDQMEPELKRTIVLKPLTILIEGMNYTLMIDGVLQAKNGQSLGQSVSLNFTTVE